MKYHGQLSQHPDVLRNVNYLGIVLFLKRLSIKKALIRALFWRYLQALMMSVCLTDYDYSAGTSTAGASDTSSSAGSMVMPGTRSSSVGT